MLTWQTLGPLSRLPGPPAAILLLVLLPFSVELTKMLPGSRDDARVGSVDSGGSCLVMVLSLSCLEGEQMLHPAPPLRLLVFSSASSYCQHFYPALGP